ncbi:MAG TPA: MFS transporter [Verrucomicrobiae bacterium]|nr:MFS transporter [Verrucomicrobiae bacterium]
MRVPQRITGYQWLVLAVAWLGWVFDSMDSTIYALVLQPALRELLPAGGIEPSVEKVSWYGGIIFSVFLIGWALGGVVFGVLADRFGRTKVLFWTILIYAGFTGAAALSRTWWELALYRFATALGIGGEWAAGAALVAEVWPEAKRARAAGVLQSAWAAGFLLAAAVSLMLKQSGWRPVFVVGIGPALIALLVRLWVKEPARWAKVAAVAPESRETSFARIRALFSPGLLRSTLVGSGLAFVAVFGLWGATNWTPTLIRSLPDLAHRDSAALNSAVSYATISLNFGSLAGYLAFGPLAERFGRRPVFALMCIGSLVMLPTTFLVPAAYGHVMVLLPLLGFFNNGIFTGFAIYLPELYPTSLRGTGAGFCFNVGRVLAASGPFLTGYLVAVLGGFGRAASAVALIYLLGLVILWFAPETLGKPLPE